jgi:hypothetical protein
LYNVSRVYFIAMNWFNVTPTYTISDLMLRSTNFDLHCPLTDIDRTLFEIIERKLRTSFNEQSVTAQK